MRVAFVAAALLALSSVTTTTATARVAEPPAVKSFHAHPARVSAGRKAPASYKDLQALKVLPVCTEEAFHLFVTHHGKQYSTKTERDARFKIFCDNLVRAHKQQKKNPHAQMGVTRFSDLTQDEFAIFVSGKPRAAKHSVRDFELAKKIGAKNFSVPDAEHSMIQTKVASGAAMDWRARGAVTGVKNQGTCGSCWSFSTTGNIEAQWAISQGSLVSLSEEELVACVPGQFCNGGSMDTAWQWLLSTQGGGITSEAAYPYVSGQGYVPGCPAAGSYASVASITTYGNLPANNEPQMASWVYSRSPVSVGVDADSWQSYNGGVLTACEAESMNHAVLVIGFDTGASPAYWTIKNSWGPGWGESGYIRIQYGVNACLVGTGPCTSQA